MPDLREDDPGPFGIRLARRYRKQNTNAFRKAVDKAVEEGDLLEEKMEMHLRHLCASGSIYWLGKRVELLHVRDLLCRKDVKTALKEAGAMACRGVVLRYSIVLYCALLSLRANGGGTWPDTTRRGIVGWGVAGKGTVHNQAVQ